MKPILFEGTETSFLSNGLGRIDALSCVVTEERNGQYDLEMEVSIDEAHYSEIVEGRILYARHDETTDKQPFEIYYISRPLNGHVTVLAHHISYRTHKITVEPFTASGITDAMAKLKNKSVSTHPFQLWTNKSTSGTMKLEQPRSLRSLLAGEQGSVLDVYGTGEYEWDKFTIKLHSQRGVDSGVTLRYGKDITELKKTTDTSNMWNGIVPFWYGSPGESEGSSGSDDEVLVMLAEKYILASNVNNYDYEMIVPLDMSSYFDEPPTESQLRMAAQNYVNNNLFTEIPASIEVSFINLASIEEFQNVAPLQRLKLCDTITVKYEKLGVSNQAKIVQTVFDVLKEKYISMTVGDVRSSLSSTMTDGLQKSLEDLKAATDRNLKKTKHTLEQEIQDVIQEQTDLITGGSGGYVVLKTDANGKPTDILVMNTDSMNTATNVLRINVNGIGFSSHGVNGPYTSAWTLDGRFNADFITTGHLSASLINAGTLSADYISGGTLTLGGSNNTYGKLVIKNASGTTIGTWDRNGIDIDSGTIDIGNGNFSVSSSGALTCQSANIQGTIYSDNGGSPKKWVRIEDGVIEGGYGNGAASGFINFNGVWGNGNGTYIYGSTITLETNDLYSLYNNTLTRAKTGSIESVYSVEMDYVNVDFDGNTVSVDVGIRYYYNNLYFENGLLMDYGYGGGGYDNGLSL